MKPNVGAIDGYIRILIFLVSICYAVMAGTLFAWLMVIPGAILFATSVMIWCPLYAMVGINTSKIY